MVTQADCSSRCYFRDVIPLALASLFLGSLCPPCLSAPLCTMFLFSSAAFKVCSFGLGGYHVPSLDFLPVFSCLGIAGRLGFMGS